ncbi:hypothetical protein FACS1894170_13400 [Planctomycetales bacterium]|nr:hypothetical protein FACS1894170_13400 [Planctomycetales bacterium]
MLASTIQKLVTENPEILPLTSGFNGIVVDDCTTVQLPADLADTLPGCCCGDGKSGKAAVKTFCRFEVLSGTLQTLLHASGKTADKKMLEQAGALPKGCLHLIDRGFFDIADLQTKSAQGIHWITRIPAGIMSGALYVVGRLSLAGCVYIVSSSLADRIIVQVMEEFGRFGQVEWVAWLALFV